MLAVPMIESQNTVVSEDEGFATIVVYLLNEIENNFSLSYETEEIPDGADGMINLNKIYV